MVKQREAMNLNQVRVQVATLLVAGLVHQGVAQTQKGLHSTDAAEFDVNITSDVKAKTSANADADVPSTGTGALGISFSTERSYGSVTFNVFNRQGELTSVDSAQSKPFANNLLIPENSGEGISNFNLTLGMRNFVKNDEDRAILDVVQLNRLGGFCYLQYNNTNWTKDSLSTPLFIQSHGVYLSYRLLDLKILNQDEDDLYLTIYGGYEGRRLGGDYALNKNEELRNRFLGTSRIAFDATAFGVLLEMGQFYGKLQTTKFDLKDDLNGFSGWQALITLGINVQFNLKAENRQASE